MSKGASKVLNYASYGAVAIAVGIGVYGMVSYNGKTARAWAKEGVNSLW